MHRVWQDQLHKKIENEVEIGVTWGLHRDWKGLCWRITWTSQWTMKWKLGFYRGLIGTLYCRCDSCQYQPLTLAMRLSQDYGLGDVNRLCSE